jgi:DNA-binding response OmpR family regulator
MFQCNFLFEKVPFLLLIYSDVKFAAITITMKKILIIDDEAEVVKVLQICLEQHGYKVVTSYDGENGLKKVKSENPDLVILDIMLPDMDGYQVCEKIKADPSTKDIPVIMLTVKSMGEDVEKALEKKADWYIVKPYDEKYLLKKIDYLLQKKSGLRR